MWSRSEYTRCRIQAKNLVWRIKRWDGIYIYFASRNWPIFICSLWENFGPELVKYAIKCPTIDSESIFNCAEKLLSFPIVELCANEWP